MPPGQPSWRLPLISLRHPPDKVGFPLMPVMASEIFGTAALFWILIPVGLLGGSLLLKVLKD